MKSDMKKCKKHMKTTGRVIMGLFFVVAGIGKLADPAVVSGQMASAGIPMSGILVWLVIIFLIVAGGMMIAGRMTCLSAILLSVYVLLASLLFHIGDVAGFMKNIALIGGLLVIGASCKDMRCCGPKKERSESQGGDNHNHHPNHDHGGHNH